MIFQESDADAWRLRYGVDPPVDLPDLGGLLNHRSVRAYKNEPVPESTVLGLVAAAQSAATSSHLQAWSLVSVQDDARRQRIAHLCGDQQQILDAAWFFAVVADLERTRVAGVEASQVPDALGTTELYTVAVVDAALAAERMVVAAERIGLGICYIGALRNHPDEVSKLLGLPEHTFGVFGLCLGVPAQVPAIKPRLAPTAVWHREQYASPDRAEFDGRMAEFYASQGQNADVPYSARMGRRCQHGYLSGRETLGAFLRSRGLLKE